MYKANDAYKDYVIAQIRKLDTKINIEKMDLKSLNITKFYLKLHWSVSKYRWLIPMVNKLQQPPLDWTSIYTNQNETEFISSDTVYIDLMESHREYYTHLKDIDFFLLNTRVPLDGRSRNTRVPINIELPPLNKTIYIIHILHENEKRLTCNDTSVEYIIISCSPDPVISLIDLIGKLLGKEIYIYAFEKNNDEKNKMYTILSNFIKTAIATTNLNLTHTTILFETLKTNDIGYIPIKPRFKKIINAYLDRYITLPPDNNSDIQERDSAYNINRHVRGNNGTEVIFHIFKPQHFEDEMSNNIEDKWWFKYLFRGPSCSKGRLVQFTGTCWLNSILNGIILGEHTRNFFIQHYSGTLDKQTRKQINSSFESFMQENMRGDKCTPLESNCLLKGFVSKATIEKAQTGTVTVKGNPAVTAIANWIINKESGEEGYCPNDGFKKVFNKLFSEKYTILEIDQPDQKKEKTIIEELIKYIKTVYWLNLPVLVISFNDIVALNFNCDLPSEVEGYILDWGILRSRHHGIVGLICEGVPYIYDSNNIIANTDWVHGDLTGYYERYEEVTGEPIVDFFKLLLVVYVRKQDPIETLKVIKKFRNDNAPARSSRQSSYNDSQPITSTKPNSNNNASQPNTPINRSNTSKNNNNNASQPNTPIKPNDYNNSASQPNTYKNISNNASNPNTNNNKPPKKQRLQNPINI